jgi:putative transposase
MIDPKHPKLSVVRQCALVGLNRSTWYYTPVEESAEDLALKALIDRLFLETPILARVRWPRCCVGRAIGSTASGFAG